MTKVLRVMGAEEACRTNLDSITCVIRIIISKVLPAMIVAFGVWSLTACSFEDDPVAKPLSASVKIVEPQAIINSSLNIHAIVGILKVDNGAPRQFTFRNGKIDPIPIPLSEGVHTLQVEFDITESPFGHATLLTSEPVPHFVSPEHYNLVFLDNYLETDSDGDSVSNLEELELSFNPHDENQTPNLGPIRIPHDLLRFHSPTAQGMTITWEPARHKIANVNIQYQLVFSAQNNINTLEEALTKPTYGNLTSNNFAIVENFNSAHSIYWNVIAQDTEGNQAIYAASLPNGMGILDNSFSNDGYVNLNTTQQPAGSQAMDVAINSSGNIFVVGRYFTTPLASRKPVAQNILANSVTTTQYPGTSTMAVWRYDVNGTLDTGFNVGTSVATLEQPLGFGSDDIANGIALTDNQRILVTGHTGSDGTGQRDMLLWQLHPGTGLTDYFFGNGKGYVTSANVRSAGLSETGNAVTIDRNGYILVAGSAEINSVKKVIVVWRYTPTGELDTAKFGNGKGYITHNGLGGDINAPSSDAYAIAVDAFNNIVVTGYTNNADGNADMSIWKFDETGTSISTFGNNKGFAVHHNAAGGNLNDAGHALVIDAQNRIVVTGMSQSSASSQSMVVWRYLQDGQPDTSFGDQQAYRVMPTGTGSNDSGNAVSLDSHGNIVVAGSSHSNTSNFDLALWRFTTDGNLDSTFGPGTGYLTHNNATTQNALADDIGTGLTINHQGKFIIAGESQDQAGAPNMVLWQYQ